MCRLLATIGDDGTTHIAWGRTLSGSEVNIFLHCDALPMQVSFWTRRARSQRLCCGLVLRHAHRPTTVPVDWSRDEPLVLSSLYLQRPKCALYLLPSMRSYQEPARRDQSTTYLRRAKQRPVTARERLLSGSIVLSRVLELRALLPTVSPSRSRPFSGPRERLLSLHARSSTTNGQLRGRLSAVDAQSCVSHRRRRPGAVP